MTENQSFGTIETDPGYGQLLSVLVRQRFWVMGVFVGVVTIAAVYSLLQRPIYQSSMQLLVEPNYQGKKESGTEPSFADANVEIDNSTQLTQMKSSQLLQKAVDLLQPEYPKLDVDELQSSLALTQIEQDKVKTKIIQVLFTNHDPVKTQKVLMAIQQVYQDYNREQQKQRLAKGLEFINEQIPRVEQQVKTAEDELERFRRSRNLVDPEVQSKALIDSLSQVRQEQRTTIAQIRDTQAKYVALQQQLRLSPQQALIASRLSQSARFQNLLNEIQKTDLALEKERVRFKDRSAFVQQWTDQRQRQQKLLSEELAQVLGADAAQGEALLAQGQLGTTDLTLASQLVDAQNTLEGLSARAQSLAQTERSLTAQLERFPNLLAEYGRLQPNVNITRDTLQQLLKARQELALEIARGGFDWQVVEQPKEGKKIGPKTKQNLLLAAVAGLMLGGVIAFVRDGTDDGVHTSDELKKQVALPLLGMMPEMAQTSGPTLLQLPFQKSDTLTPTAMDLLHWQPFREALDLLYKNIQLLPIASGLRSLVVTSALAGEGKSTLALGLAISAARSNKRVLLIDADLRRPSLHKQLNLPNDRGLSTLLEGNMPILDQPGIQSLHRYADIPVSVLTAGPTPPDSARLLNSSRMEDLISMFEQNYDLVVLDAPPVLGIVDAVSLASFCWGVLLVGRIGQVTRTEFMQATSMLTTLNVIGVVANGSKTVTNPYLAYERKP
ncbi:polysaccharide biosynthesis tyrosine autokinase [Kovacikia minuta CCNUW1]|uniref:GumC family protein n=1 Tax=Kovacikia minuta TaxID=2931930 RepID=UPI001CCA3C1E|nr:polysaccharide biosynthesis tyrosine autokinase [Kovacikia minuta]UBF27183.1 polysaccharide biosynthesis tyrosine autokinase [Kovacikia minuta CCNUW1]